MHTEDDKLCKIHEFACQLNDAVIRMNESGGYSTLLTLKRLSPFFLREVNDAISVRDIATSKAKNSESRARIQAIKAGSLPAYPRELKIKLAGKP
jgi:hypothetical protein